MMRERERETRSYTMLGRIGKRCVVILRQIDREREGGGLLIYDVWENW
jgi:hypothetical protein